jgi:hypothetical protein
MMRLLLWKKSAEEISQLERSPRIHETALDVAGNLALKQIRKSGDLI